MTCFTLERNYDILQHKYKDLQIFTDKLVSRLAGYSQCKRYTHCKPEASDLCDRCQNRKLLDIQ